MIDDVFNVAGTIGDLCFSNGQESYYYQLFLEKPDHQVLLLPTTQQLLSLSFLQSDIKLAEVGLESLDPRTTLPYFIEVPFNYPDRIAGTGLSHPTNAKVWQELQNVPKNSSQLRD